MSIYIYTEVDLRDKMLASGYREILKCQIKGKEYYVFQNQSSDKFKTFSLEDKKRMFFSNKLYFV